MCGKAERMKRREERERKQPLSSIERCDIPPTKKKKKKRKEIRETVISPGNCKTCRIFGVQRKRCGMAPRTLTGIFTHSSGILLYPSAFFFSSFLTRVEKASQAFLFGVICATVPIRQRPCFFFNSLASLSLFFFFFSSVLFSPVLFFFFFVGQPQPNNYRKKSGNNEHRFKPKATCKKKSTGCCT